MSQQNAANLEQAFNNAHAVYLAAEADYFAHAETCGACRSRRLARRGECSDAAALRDRMETLEETCNIAEEAWLNAEELELEEIAV